MGVVWKCFRPSVAHWAIKKSQKLGHCSRKMGSIHRPILIFNELFFHSTKNLGQPETCFGPFWVAIGLEHSVSVSEPPPLRAPTSDLGTETECSKQTNTSFQAALNSLLNGKITRLMWWLLGSGRSKDAEIQLG